jgi:hypothetical protein
MIVYWTQHSRDENGPGQRVLAKVCLTRQPYAGCRRLALDSTKPQV